MKVTQHFIIILVMYLNYAYLANVISESFCMSRDNFNKIS